MGGESHDETCDKSRDETCGKSCDETRDKPRDEARDKPCDETYDESCDQAVHNGVVQCTATRVGNSFPRREWCVALPFTISTTCPSDAPRSVGPHVPLTHVYLLSKPLLENPAVARPLVLT